MKFLTFLLDFLFPPSPETRAVHALSPEQALSKFPLASTTPYPFITSLFAYKDPLVSTMVLNIKNKRDMHALRVAASALYQKLPANSLLIPIPITKKRRKERGYNQCELLINEILKFDTGKNFTTDFNLLIRTKHTSQQKLKNRHERLASTESLFEIYKEIADKNIQIILIDDVATTGSTLKDARETLLRAGYTNVQAFTITH